MALRVDAQQGGVCHLGGVHPVKRIEAGERGCDRLDSGNLFGVAIWRGVLKAGRVCDQNCHGTTLTVCKTRVTGKAAMRLRCGCYMTDSFRGALR